MTIVDFLVALDSAVSTFTENTLAKESITLADRRLGIINQNLVLAYYDTLEYYFRDTVDSVDANFFTEEEITVVIDKINNIMKTYLYTDFS